MDRFYGKSTRGNGTNSWPTAMEHAVDQWICNKYLTYSGGTAISIGVMEEALSSSDGISTLQTVME